MTISRYKPGDIILLEFPYSNQSGAKRRPALVLARIDFRNELLCLMLTSHFANNPCDYRLTSWRTAGLLKPTVARLSRLLTVVSSVVLKKLGNVPDWELWIINDKVKSIIP